MTASRWAAMVAGTLALVGGVACLIASGLGTGPYDALAVGLTGRTGIDIALVVTALNLALVAAAWGLGGIRPGPGTAVALLGIGPALAICLAVLAHLPDGNLALNIALWAAGAGLLATGIALTITAGLGVGPYDAATLAINARTGWSVPRSRLALDVAVAVIAVGFGGPIWLGTVALAVVMPPLLNITIPLTRRLRPPSAPTPGAPIPAG